MLRALTRWARAAPRWRPALATTAAVETPSGASLRERCRDDGFEAASLAARAERASRVDDDVADLAGGVSGSGEQLVIDHQTGADAFGDADEQDVARLGRGEGEFAEGGGVSVVGNAHRQPEGGRQLGAEGDVVETEVGCPDDDAVRVHDAWSGDADTEQRSIGLVGELAGELDRSGGDALPGQSCARRLAAAHAAAGDDLPGQVDDGTADLAGATEVETDDVAGVSDNRDQRGRFADRARQRAPSFLDHPLVDELADHVGHGGGGEPAGSRQVGAAHRAGVEQRTKEQLPVLPPRVGRQRLAPTLEACSLPVPLERPPWSPLATRTTIRQLA